MTADTAAPQARFGVILLALGAAVMWGLWWIPVRYIEDLGLGGAWATLAMALGALPVILLGAVTDRSLLRLTPKAILGAFLVGIAITLYGSALTFTDVVRAVLLFYLAPVWSTLIECVFLGRRWTWRSTLALALSFAGAILVFRGEVSGSSFNGGDVMALASGMAWSTGAALIFVAPPASARRLALATCIGAVIVSSLVIWIGGARAGTLAPDLVTDLAIAETAGISLLSGTIYLAPIIIVTMWAARRLPPALFSFLLTAEILSGVGSSALLLDERFGWPEALGAVLIASGAIVEAVTTPTGSKADDALDQASGEQR